jgi:hypothetical protein
MTIQMEQQLESVSSEIGQTNIPCLGSDACLAWGANASDAGESESIREKFPEITEHVSEEYPVTAVGRILSMNSLAISMQRGISRHTRKSSALHSCCVESNNS